MGGKLTSGGIKLPETGDVEQSKVVISVDGKEADETGNIDLGGAFDYVDKKTQIRGCKALTWNTLRIQGIDDWERQRNTEFSVDEESLTVSTLTGEYVYIAEVDEENKSSAYYRSDNGGATYSRHIVPTEGVDVKLIRTSDTGQVVLLSTHIGGVLISEDYGKTWIIPHSLDGSTSNSDSSWFISMSSNGQNLIYPNSDGNLYLENPNSSDFGLHTLVLPSGVTPNSIKEFFVSNHTDRASIQMVMMTRNGNVYTSVNGGVQWSHAISGVNGMYTDKDVDKIYVIKGTTVQYRSINGTGFTTKVDFKTYSKYQDLTRDPNVFQLRSIFVSHDHINDKSNIAVFTVSGTGSSYGTSNQAVVEDDVGYDVVEGEDVLTKPYAEKTFTGILISEDSGDTWDLSQIKYTWGLGTPFFHWPGGLDQTVGYPRLQLIENFESGLFIYSGVTPSDSCNNIIRICDKSTSYSSTSKMILDGGITLGQSMEADTEYFNKMPGTIEYENFSDGYVFHFKESSWTFYEHRTSPQFGADDIFHKPLTLTGSTGWYGKPVKSIEFSHTLKGMNRLESNNVALTNPRIQTGELLMKGGSGFLSDYESLIDEGFTEDEAIAILTAYDTSGNDIVSSGIKPSDITSLDTRVTALENVTADYDDSRVSFFADVTSMVAYHSNGRSYHEGYLLVDTAGQLRFMGIGRHYRTGNYVGHEGHVYDYFGVINLPNHDKNDKIVSALLGVANIFVITESGTAYASGYNAYGQIAIEPTPSVPSQTSRNHHNMMTKINHNVGIKKISNGGVNTYNVLYIDENDVLWGSGWNVYGYILGQGKTRPSYYDSQTYGETGWPASSYNSSKQMIKIMTGVKDALIGGIYHGYTCIRTSCYRYNHTTYVLKNNGEVWTCGYNGYGQRGGTSAQLNSNQYTLTTTGADRIKLNDGHNASSFYILKGTSLYASGYNAYGQLGINVSNNTSGYSGGLAITTLSKSNVRDFWIPSGDNYGSTIVAGTDNKLYVTGYNGYGSLGTGNLNNITTGWVSVTLPTSPSGQTSSSIVSNIVDIKMAGRYSAIILYKDAEGKGKLLVSGYNAFGQLGLGDTQNRDTFQHVVLGPDDIKEVFIMSGYNDDTSHLTVLVRDGNGNLWHTGYSNYYITGRLGYHKTNFDRVKL